MRHRRPFPTTPPAVPDDAPPAEVVEEVLEVTGTGDGALTEVVVDEVLPQDSEG